MDTTNDQKEYDECPICCTTGRVSSWVTCPSCSKSSCRYCVRKYLTDEGNPKMTPDCMYCHKQWDFEFVATHSHEDFHNRDYRIYRAKVLLQREKSLLPGCQDLAREQIKRRQLKSLILQLQQRNKVLQQELQNNRNVLLELKRRQRTDVWDEKKQTETKKSFKYTAPCPRDDCNGYVGDRWKCGLCKQKVCSQCHQSKISKKSPDYTPHVCDDDEVKTAQILSKDTKPCPSCKVPITYISGCDQMWCPVCHTAFSWKTGQIETGTIHNPHFYEFQRKMGKGAAPRNHGDMVCGRVPGYCEIRNKFRQFNLEVPKWVEEARRLIDHINYVELPKYPNTLDHGTHLDLRIKFLIKDIDEKKWMSELKRREKKREKNRAIHMVLRMFTDTLSSIFGNICQLKSGHDIHCSLIEMHSLRKYTNDNLKSIGDRFKNKIPDIKDSWNFNPVGKVSRR